MKTEYDEKKAIICGLAGNTIWGMGYYFMTLALRYSTPAVMLAWRFSFAFLIMNVWKIVRKEKISFKGKKLIPFIVFVGIEPVCFFLESYSVLLTNATFAGMVMAITPVVAMIMSAVFLKENPTKKQIIYCAFPVVGVIMITVAGKSLGVVTLVGVALCFAFTIASGIYKTTNRSAAQQFTPFERTYFLLGFCALTYVAYALIESRNDISLLFGPIHEIGFIVPVSLMTVLNSVLANFLVNMGAGRISVTRMAVFGAVSTVVSTFAGIVLLKEPYSPMLLFGALLVVFGVWKVTVSGK